MIKFWPYTFAAWKEAFKNSISLGIDQTITLFVAVAVLTLQYRWGITPRENVNTRWLTLVLPYLIIVFLLFIYHVWMAAWQIYQKDVREGIQWFTKYAEDLKKQLEEVNDLYEFDKDCEEKLIYPLQSNIVPEKVEHFRQKALRDFWTAYRLHIAMLRDMAPSFHSCTVDGGFPRSGINYRDVILELENHRALLLNYLKK